MKILNEMLRHADVGITLKIYHHTSAKVIKGMHREYSPLLEIKRTNLTNRR